MRGPVFRCGAVAAAAGRCMSHVSCTHADRRYGARARAAVLLTFMLVLQQSLALKIFVFPDVPGTDLVTWKHMQGNEILLLKRLMKSRYYTTNISEADFSWIPHLADHTRHNVTILQTLDHIRSNYGRTWHANHARHIVPAFCDHGPGDCMFNRPLMYPNTDVPHDVNPANKERKIMFMMFNGHSDFNPNPMGGAICLTCFQPGKDIMIPTMENVCGPLCGWSLKELRRESVWALYFPNTTFSSGRVVRLAPSTDPKPPADSAELEARVDEWLERPRKNLFFAGGRLSACPQCGFNGRGAVWEAHRNKSDYLIHDIAPAGSVYIPFLEAMRDSTFCFSPPGQDMGDPDRYVAAVMFGCIPVMVVTTESSGGKRGWPLHEMALPLEEILPWRDFAVLIHVHELKDHLDPLLRYLVSSGRAAQMRQNMKKVWRKLLYSSVIQSYFGEDGEGDAFEQIMKTLAARIRHEDGPLVHTSLEEGFVDMTVHGRQHGSFMQLGRQRLRSRGHAQHNSTRGIAKHHVVKYR